MTGERAEIEAADTTPETEVATLGGGCFWCVEAVFQEVRGVERVVSGYAGGTTVDPTYDEVCSGSTGHAEVVQIHFDPARVAYDDLLRVFFTVHDPTTRDRQGADVGSQYRSVILWSDDAQRRAARAVMQEIEASGVYDAPVVTELEPLDTFYEAEPHHQDFRRRNPHQPYCRIVIEPKLAKFRRSLGRLRRSPMSAVVFFLASAALAFAPARAMSQALISTSAMLERPPVVADHRIAYGPEPEQFGDLYLPAGDGPFPVVVVIHGGCWRSIAGLDYTSHIASDLVSSGWAAWNVEFRRIDQPGGAFPGILNDVSRAAAHLRQVADEHPLDLDRVVALGHSSGGHLALWLAAEPPSTLPLAGVVGLAAISDLADFHARSARGCGADIVPSFLGADPAAEPERLRRASPAERVPLGVPQLLVTGSEDRTVPPEHVEVYARRASEAGDVVEVVTTPGAGHFEVVAPWAATFGSARAAIRAFLARLADDG